jgi:translation initiation factor 5B
MQVRIGPVVRKDVMRASTMLEHEEKYAVILAFDVKVRKQPFPSHHFLECM